jgi:hypothetical protein
LAHDDVRRPIRAWKTVPQQDTMIPRVRYGENTAADRNARGYVERLRSRAVSRIAGFLPETGLPDHEVGGCAITARRLVPPQQSMVACVAYE